MISYKIEMDSDSFHTKMMQRAIDQSKKSVKNPTIHEPFGAVIVRNSDHKILGEGCNNIREMMDPSLHGEVVAIKMACKAVGSVELPGCTLYTSCEPCPMCVSLIWITKIEHVYYGSSSKKAWDSLTDLTDVMKCVTTPTEKRDNYTQLLRDEAEKVIMDFAEEDRKIPADKKYHGLLKQ